MSSADGLVQAQAVSLEELQAPASANQLYAILDACDAPAVPPKVAELGPLAVSLYRGSAEVQYAAIAPYLVRVDPVLLRWITATLWQQPWGMLAVTDVDLATLRAHFRKFLIIRAPSGERWYFRYYDPRVLPPFLGACEQAELLNLFGPVRAFGVPAPDGNGVVLYRLKSAERPPRVAPKITLRTHMAPQGGGSG